LACYHPNFYLPEYAVHLSRFQFLERRLAKLKQVKDAKGLILKRFEAEEILDVRPDLEQHIMQVPCGQCIGCRLQRSREWADRCVLESLQYPPNHCWCVTLTYSDEAFVRRDKHGNLLHPSKVIVVRNEDGLVNERFNLYPRDLELFFKRLRKTFAPFGYDNIRYFVGAEYGDRGQRPHFHLLLFNISFPDLRVSDRCYSENGEIFESDLLTRVWSDNMGSNRVPDYHPIGIAAINRFSWHSAAYCARYAMKKMQGKAKKERNATFTFLDPETGEVVNFVDEFPRMSTHPGLGYKYFEENRDKIYRTDEVFVPDGSLKVAKRKPCKYFDKIFARDNPFDEERMEQIKAERKAVAIAGRIMELEQVTMTEEDYLLVQEQQKIDQLQRLVRKL
jgi:hypothetical protein